LLRPLDPFTKILCPTQRPILTGDIFQLTDVLVAPVLGGEGNHTRPTLKIQDGCKLPLLLLRNPVVRGKSRSLPPQTVLSSEFNTSPIPDSARSFSVASTSAPTGATSRRRSNSSICFAGVLDETPVQRLRISSIEPLRRHSGSHQLLRFEPSHRPTFPYAAAIRFRPHPRRHASLVSRRALRPAASNSSVIVCPMPPSSRRHCRFPQRNRLPITPQRWTSSRARPFTYLHVFSYSQTPRHQGSLITPRPTVRHVIKTRARELRSLADSKSAAFRRSQIGRTLRVLTLRRDGGCRRSRFDSSPLRKLSSGTLAPTSSTKSVSVYAAITREEDKHLLAAPVECASLAAR